MTNRIENCLPHGSLVQRGNIKDEQSLLKVLSVIAQVDLGPHRILEQEKSTAVVFTLLGGTRRFVGAVFEDHLSLRQVFPQLLMGTKQH